MRAGGESIVASEQYGDVQERGPPKNDPLMDALIIPMCWDRHAKALLPVKYEATWRPRQRGLRVLAPASLLPQ